MGLYVILFSSLYSVFQSLYDGHVVFVIFAMKEKGKAGRERDKEKKRERGNRGDRAPECCVALLRNHTKVFDKAACLLLWERDDGHALEGTLEERRSLYSPQESEKRRPYLSLQDPRDNLPTVAVAAVRTWPCSKAVIASCLLSCHLLISQDVATPFLSRSAGEPHCWQAATGLLRLAYNSRSFRSLLAKENESVTGAHSLVSCFCSVCWDVLPLSTHVKLLLAPQNTISLLPLAGSPLPSGGSVPSPPAVSGPGAFPSQPTRASPICCPTTCCLPVQYNDRESLY